MCPCEPRVLALWWWMLQRLVSWVWIFKCSSHLFSSYLAEHLPSAQKRCCTLYGTWIWKRHSFVTRNLESQKTKIPLLAANSRNVVCVLTAVTQEGLRWGLFEEGEWSITAGVKRREGGLRTCCYRHGLVSFTFRTDLDFFSVCKNPAKPENLNEQRL